MGDPMRSEKSSTIVAWRMQDISLQWRLKLQVSKKKKMNSNSITQGGAHQCTSPSTHIKASEISNASFSHINS